MSTPWESPIIRISTGKLNTVNDTVIANEPTGQPGTSNSRFAGQLGKVLYVSQDQIGLLTSTAVGTLYNGGYRYVRRRATDADSPAALVGQIAFIDTVVSNWESAYQVTSVENLSSVDNAVMIAGIFINALEPGNYGFIQIIGEVVVRFRASLTAAGAIGSRVYAAGAGAGADNGLADVLTADSTSLANTRFLGNAVTAPVGGSTARVMLNFKNPWF